MFFNFVYVLIIFMVSFVKSKVKLLFASIVYSFLRKSQYASNISQYHFPPAIIVTPAAPEKSGTVKGAKRHGSAVRTLDGVAFFRYNLRGDGQETLLRKVYLTFYF